MYFIRESTCERTILDARRCKQTTSAWVTEFLKELLQESTPIDEDLEEEATK